MSTVYILGAGASAGAGIPFKCPSAKNFFSTASSLLNSFPGHVSKDYPNLISFLEKYFRLDFKDIEKAGLDMQDVLTFLDLELDYSDSAKEIDLLLRSRGEFMQLLSLIFGRAISGPPCPYHASLAAALQKGDTVISFNYDLLMDLAVESNVPGWTLTNGYGFTPVSTGEDQYKNPPVFLLKPHGSFNWINCRTCGKTYILPPGQTILIGNKSLNCMVGKPESHLLERFIIPPSLKKDVHGKHMQQIWLKSHDALQKAKRIVVIGYSLPATDFLVKRLFYRSLSQNRSLLEFELVDRKNRGADNPLLEKYRRILYRHGKVRIVCDKKNIMEYTGGLIKMNKRAVNSPPGNDKITLPDNATAPATRIN